MSKLSETPKKPCNANVKICRCCNTSLLNYYDRIDLFGKVSEKENLLKKLKEIGNIKVCEQDEDFLPTKICRKCFRKLTGLAKAIDDFRNLCSKAREIQIEDIENSRIKRGRKACSPQERNEKRRPAVTAEENSTALRIQSLFPPTPDQHPGSAVSTCEILPLPATAAEKDDSVAEEQPNHQIHGTELLKDAGLRNRELLQSCKEPISKVAMSKLLYAVQWGIPEDIAKKALAIKPIKGAIKLQILKEINDQCQSLCVRTRGQPSILKDTSVEALENVDWGNIMREMRERVPDVLDFIATVAAPRLKKNGDDQIPPVCMVYAMMMNQRWQELSLIQKISTVILGIGHSSKKTFERMRSLGVCQSRANYLKTMDAIGHELVEKVRSVMKENSLMEIRVTFDNFDFKMLANIILKNHRNSDFHWITHYLTFDRVSSAGLDDSKPLADITTFSNSNYLLSKDELQLFRRDFTVLVSRVLVEFFPCLNSLVIPKHINHRYSEEMAKKSVIVSLPIVPFNQSKHADVVQYLETLQDLLCEVHAPEDMYPLKEDVSQLEKLERTEKILKGKRIPLYGDLLGRERVTGAKKTRAGCDYPCERFENIVESAAIWHAKQSFLGYIWEQLYNTKSARDVGTLYNIRQRFGLVNVSSKVKNNFESANSLMLSTAKAYLCSAFMEYAGLERLDGTPNNITSFEPKDLEKVIGCFVDEYVMVEFDVEKVLRQQKERAKQQMSTTPAPRSYQQLVQQDQGQPINAGPVPSPQQTQMLPDQAKPINTGPASRPQQSQMLPDQAQPVNTGTGLRPQQSPISPDQAQPINTGPGSRPQQSQMLPEQVQPMSTCPVSRPQRSKIQQGQIVALLQPMPDKGPEVIGVGKVVAPPPNITTPPATVVVYVAYVESQRSGINIHQLQIGQYVVWQEDLLALCGQNTANHKDKSDNQQPEPKPVVMPAATISKLPLQDAAHDDRILNYGLQVIQLGTLLMQLHDTEKEGDGERNVRNAKLLMLYFRSRSRGMKYAFEMMRFLTCVKALYTEKVAHKIIHGQFVNWRGGDGKNVANDLKQEHFVKAHKTVLKDLVANKTLKAVERGTKASCGLKGISDNVDKQCHIAPDYTLHTSLSMQEDEREMIDLVHSKRPFVFKAGRKHNSFPTISNSPLDQLDAVKLDTWLTKHKKKLASCMLAGADGDSSDESESEVEEEESEEDEDDNDSD